MKRVPGPGPAEARACRRSVRAHVRYPQDLFNVQRGAAGAVPHQQPGDVVQRHAASGRCPATRSTRRVDGRPAAVLRAGQSADTTGGTAPAVPADDARWWSTARPTWPPTSPSTAIPGPDYGKITRAAGARASRTIQGPEQVANVFKSNDRHLEGHQPARPGAVPVIHGNLLTLPLGGSFLYVEPLYVQGNSTLVVPDLQRVLVTYGDKVGYGATLDDALRRHPVQRSTGSSMQLGQTTGAGASTKHRRLGHSQTRRRRRRRRRPAVVVDVQPGAHALWRPRRARPRSRRCWPSSTRRPAAAQRRLRQRTTR